MMPSTEWWSRVDSRVCDPYTLTNLDVLALYVLVELPCSLDCFAICLPPLARIAAITPPA